MRKNICWDSDPDLVKKFKKLISTNFDFSREEDISHRAKQGLEILRANILRDN